MNVMKCNDFENFKYPALQPTDNQTIHGLDQRNIRHRHMNSDLYTRMYMYVYSVHMYVKYCRRLLFTRY